MKKSVSRGRPGGSYNGEDVSGLGSLLGEARAARGVTLKAVAKRLGVSFQFISNIEHGRALLPARYVAAISSFLCLDQSVVATLALQKTKVYQDLQKLA